jgi:hypothetical protein
MFWFGFNGICRRYAFISLAIIWLKAINWVHIAWEACLTLYILFQSIFYKTSSFFIEKILFDIATPLGSTQLTFWSRIRTTISLDRDRDRGVVVIFWKVHFLRFFFQEEWRFAENWRILSQVNGRGRPFFPLLPNRNRSYLVRLFERIYLGGGIVKRSKLLQFLLVWQRMGTHSGLIAHSLAEWCQ